LFIFYEQDASIFPQNLPLSSQLSNTPPSTVQLSH